MIGVDKGGLKSNASYIINDIILNKPEIIFPQNNTTVNYFDAFKIKTVSFPAIYKIIIQSNEFFGTIDEINFSTSDKDSIISVNFNSYFLESYRKYYWRIIVYSGYSNDPNTFSGLNSFIIKLN